MARPADEADQLADEMEEQIEQQRHRGVQPHCFAYLGLLVLVIILVIAALLLWAERAHIPFG